MDLPPRIEVCVNTSDVAMCNLRSENACSYRSRGVNRPGNAMPPAPLHRCTAALPNVWDKQKGCVVSTTSYYTRKTHHCGVGLRRNDARPRRVALLARCTPSAAAATAAAAALERRLALARAVTPPPAANMGFAMMERRLVGVLARVLAACLQSAPTASATDPGCATDCDSGCNPTPCPPPRSLPSNTRNDEISLEYKPCV